MRKISILLLTALLAGCSGISAAAPTPDATPTPAPHYGCGIEEACTVSNNNPADMSGYEGFAETEHVFVEITMTEAIAMFADGDSGFIYFGKPDCPWCVELLPILNELAKEHGILVWYVDRNKASAEEKTAMTALLTGWLALNEEGDEHLYVPNVTVLENGQVIANHVGTVDTHDAYERLMTDEEIADLTAVLNRMLDQAAR